MTALLVHEAARRGPWRAVAVGLGATAADACFLLLAAAGAIVLLAERPAATGALSLAGAALLLVYARGAWRSARAAAGESEASRPATFASGFLAAATSPFNLAWWLGPGTVLLAAQGPGLVVGLFAGILAWVLLFCHGVARIGARVAGFQRAAAYASAAILAAFAAWVAWHGFGLLGVIPGP